MPTFRVTTRKPRTDGESRAMLADLSHAVSTVLATPDAENWIVLESVDESRFFPGGASAADFALVDVDLFPGRTLEKKRAFYAAIVGALERHGVSGKNVRIVAREIGLENWGIYGGRVAADVFGKP